ncbi:hypothetical protein GCM10009682_58020 [Luedemannella flava]|uniref:2'-5' RNA ligase family protein n=1 Tax=Luedemannella flava TaxID=349316 RepID=A0ABN2MMB9_9ACTN
MADRYQELWTQGSRAILRGDAVTQDGPLGTGRWPVSIALRLDETTRSTFATLASEAAAVIGDAYHFDHHVTVRAVHPASDDTIDEHRMTLYADALREAVAGLGPVRLRFDGLTLAPGNVMACGYPVDDTADRLRARLAESLATRDADGFERGYRRDIWHATLIGFAGPVNDPQQLVDWVARRRREPLATARCDAVELNRWNALADRQVAAPLCRVSLTAD